MPFNINGVDFVGFIPCGEVIPDRECIAKFSRDNRDSDIATKIEISFPDVLKHGREVIEITHDLIGNNLKVPFKPGMVDLHADCILNGSGFLLIKTYY